MKNEKSFYCRQRKCIYHKGISKNQNVICEAENPEIEKTKDGNYCKTCIINE